MSLLVVEGVSKSWSQDYVLRNVNAAVAPAERIGMVGPNGQGKTTLLRILAGVETPTQGNIQRRKDLRIGYLPQDPPTLQGSSLRGAMLEAVAELRALEYELHELSHQLEKHSTPQLLSQFGQVQHEFEARGGYDYPRKIEQVLTGLAFDQDSWDKPLSQLSGGQRTRAFLGKLLLEEPDLLLLDEPTNHLDYETVEWLETWLQNFNGAMVIVSHDRYFLDRVTNRTWEVAASAVECYDGGYSRYLPQREERFLERMRRYEAQQQYIEETQEFIRRFIAGQRSKEAQGRRTRLERFLAIEAIPKPIQPQTINLRLRAPQRTGDIVLSLHELAAGYDKPLAMIESLEILRGQRVAIVGPNGCGKTTLLRTILNQLDPLAGQVRWGANVQLAYLSQTHSELRPDMTALEAVKQIDPSITEQRGRGLLGSMLLSNDDAFKRISELSGGQRSRVLLARLMLQKPNVLVMDEPTNHLDVSSQEALGEVLAEFDGTIIFVSHDRYLIQALASDIWAMHDGQVHTLRGDWERYLRWRVARQEQAAPAGSDAKQDRRREYAQRREDQKDRRKQENQLRKAQRRFEQIETSIHELEDQMKVINSQLEQASAAGDLAKITELGSQYAQQDAKLRELYQEWEELSVVIEG